MRKNIFLSLLLVFLENICFSHDCHAAEETPFPLSVEVKVIREYYGPFYGSIPINAIIPHDSIAKEKEYNIEVSITNTSSKAAFFWLMTCSWDDNFIINNDYIFFKGWSCNSNFPYSCGLLPGESKVLTATLMRSLAIDYPRTNNTFWKQVEETKLGLIVLFDVENNSAKVSDYHLSMNDKSSWKKLFGATRYTCLSNIIN